MSEFAPWSVEEFNGMPYRLLGKSGLRASSVGLGTWKFGYPETGDESRVDEKTAFKILDKAIELGVTFWDTANRYNAGSGNSERIIGKWIKNNPDQRRNVVISTKIFGGMDGRTPNHSRLSRMNILDSVYACIDRLQTDCIDLLYFHAYDPIIPVEESLAAIEDLVRQDLIRYFGVSNFTITQMEEYRRVSMGYSVRSKIVAVQNQFDILNGENPTQGGVLNYAASAGISFIAWSPLARGLLTERYIDINNVGPGDRLFDEGESSMYTNKMLHQKTAKLAELSKEWGITLNQMTLAYMLSLPGMGPVIPSSSSVAQLESNAISGKITLSLEQLKEIKKILEEQPSN